MIYVILGQTASGKTTLAVKLAREFDLPIISADALQCYKMMQIGTDKPTKEQIEGLQFYFNDEYNPDEEVSVYLFQKECRKILNKYIKQNKDIIVVGGNFLYVKALLFDYNLSEEEKIPQSKYENLSVFELQNILKKINTDLYNNIDINNPRRLIRAIVNTENGKNMEKTNNKLLYDAKFYCIDIDKDLGNKLMDERIDKMIKDGFENECRELLLKYPKTLRPFQCIGYKEMMDKISKNEKIDEDTINLIKIHTHQYAKRQRTFLKHQFCNIINDSKENIECLISQDIKNRRKENDIGSIKN